MGTETCLTDQHDDPDLNVCVEWIVGTKDACVDDVASTDYLLEVGGKGHRFNAESYIGEMGWFVNQRRLVEGLEVMCRKSGVQTGAMSYAAP